jgi:hypothetical protein
MRRLLNLLVLTLCSGVLLPAIADGMSYPQDGQRIAQKKGAKKKQISQAQREPKDSQATHPRTNEERLAKNHIAVAFPRTRSLLGYLERRDAKAFGAVLEHSQKITRRLENAALQMAREHHPELSSLMLRFRTKLRFAIWSVTTRKFSGRRLAGRLTTALPSGSGSFARKLV